MSIHEHNHTYKTIHDFHSHAHYGWDNSLSPITEVSSGQTVNYEIIEASGGQFTRYSTKEDVANINFAKRSEEHTSELQSRGHIVCRLLLEKKKLGRWR